MIVMKISGVWCMLNGVVEKMKLGIGQVGLLKCSVLYVIRKFVNVKVLESRKYYIISLLQFVLNGVLFLFQEELF